MTRPTNPSNECPTYVVGDEVDDDVLPLHKLPKLVRVLDLVIHALELFFNCC